MHCICTCLAGVVANDDVDFAAHAGEVHALVGENGPGESSKLKSEAARSS
jgi:ABC-type uncharacterized transport system ATPase subunit